MGRKALALANTSPHEVAASTELDPSVTWNDVREIADLWKGPFALKGVMSTDDACHALDAGVTAIIVSNHGGRQLDGAAAPIQVLPDIVRALAGRAEVVLDGGIRRGVHMLKALALGARACSVGRPYLYGLAAGGEAGVLRALDILRTELVLAMQLSGCAALHDINSTMVARYP
jgi:isopentenyl diphosphate isomerase/L-lactate dehydrogenase-like FMN-dependent dehydrogenase